VDLREVVDKLPKLVSSVASSTLAVLDKVQSSEPPADCGMSNERGDEEEARSVY
jgi:hypothetical protein